MTSSHRTSVSVDACGAHSGTQGERGRVLIADDEARIRAMVGIVLSHARFHVDHAANGPEAAYLIHQVEGKIDVVITDVMMPLVTGPELAAWVRRVWPHIPVLFVSAFFQPSRLELSREDLDLHFLAKPFGLSSLTCKVELMMSQTLKGKAAQLGP